MYDRRITVEADGCIIKPCFKSVSTLDQVSWLDLELDCFSNSYVSAREIVFQSCLLARISELVTEGYIILYQNICNIQHSANYLLISKYDNKLKHLYIGQYQIICSVQLDGYLMFLCNYLKYILCHFLNTNNYITMIMIFCITHYWHFLNTNNYITMIIIFCITCYYDYSNVCHTIAQLLIAIYFVHSCHELSKESYVVLSTGDKQNDTTHVDVASWALCINILTFLTLCIGIVLSDIELYDIGMHSRTPYLQYMETSYQYISLSHMYCLPPLPLPLPPFEIKYNCFEKCLSMLLNCLPVGVLRYNLKLEKAKYNQHNE